MTRRRRCTFCGRLMPATQTKRDPDCVESGCTTQHWMCRSEVSCALAIRETRSWTPQDVSVPPPGRGGGKRRTKQKAAARRNRAR